MPVKKVESPLLKLTQEQIQKIAIHLGAKWPERYTLTHFWDTKCWSCDSPVWFGCFARFDGWSVPITIKSGNSVPTCFDGVFLCHNCENKFTRVPADKFMDKSTTESEKLYKKFVKTNLPYHITCEHTRADGFKCFSPIQSKSFFKKGK